MLTGTPAYKVVIINGRVELLELFETALQGRRFDVVLLDSSAQAYSQIKRMQPNLVILCMQLDDIEAFQLLSMLQLDDGTKAIPVLTCTADLEPDEEDRASRELFDAQMLGGSPEAWMN
jgi:DNA-binding response OmpR family regulator